MGFTTIIIVVVVVLAIIGGGIENFYSDVSSGIHKTMSYVEKSPVLKNITEETKDFATEQGGKLANEVLSS